MAAIGAAGLKYLFKRSTEFYHLIEASLVAVLGLMITSKVLSNQFILWIYPLFLFVRPRKGLVVAVSLAIAVLSQAIFPSFFVGLMRLETAAICVLAARNGLLVFLFVLLLVENKEKA